MAANTDASWCARALVTLCLLVFPVLVPLLEVNASHLLNPSWPAHARLHEAWQLLANGAVALCAIAWTWMHGRFRQACLLGMLLAGSFVLAWLLREAYGGSMQGTTTGGSKVLGVDLAVAVMTATLCVFAKGLLGSRARSAVAASRPPS